jgi:hypothetical protein
LTTIKRPQADFLLFKHDKFIAEEIAKESGNYGGGQRYIGPNFWVYTHRGADDINNYV